MKKHNFLPVFIVIGFITSVIGTAYYYFIGNGTNSIILMYSFLLGAAAMIILMITDIISHIIRLLNKKAVSVNNT